ncbi:MAG: hypothetical protein L0H19_08290 [Salinisphaera sp.]|nr:hypothetical protein [Salinisphaera sp.]
MFRLCSSLLVLLAALLAAHPAVATQRAVVKGTVVSVPGTPSASNTPATLPHRGMNMDAVVSRYGAPQTRHPAVGDPPITRWDYPGFSVFFEYDLVLHSVVPGDPPPLHHRNQLFGSR